MTSTVGFCQKSTQTRVSSDVYYQTKYGWFDHGAGVKSDERKEQRRGYGEISPFTGRRKRHYRARIYSPLIAATLYPQYFDARALDTITGRNAERNRARIEWAIERGERFEDVIERLGVLAVA